MTDEDARELAAHEVHLEGIELLASLLGLVDLLGLGELPAAIELVQFARELCELAERAALIRPPG